MREIKFRGKDINTGKWSYGSLITCEQYTDIWTVAEDDVVARIEVDPETVGQSTGIRDKAGNEIFEGDFVRYYNKIEGELKCAEIYWDTLSCAFFGTYQGLDFFQLRECMELLVEGNIHDNPGLITYIPWPTKC